MKKPTKVTLEITADQWNLKVFAGKEIISNRTMKMNGRGSAKATCKGGLEDDLSHEDLQNLVDAIEGEHPMDIACELMDLRDLES